MNADQIKHEILNEIYEPLIQAAGRDQIRPITLVSRAVEVLAEKMARMMDMSTPPSETSVDDGKPSRIEALEKKVIELSSQLGEAINKLSTIAASETAKKPEKVAPASAKKVQDTIPEDA